MPPVGQSEAAVTGIETVSDQILGALAAGADLTTALEPAAAGLTAGAGADEGHGFVRLAQIVEGVEPLAFDFGAAAVEAATFPVNEGDVIIPEPVANTAPDVGDYSASTPEDARLRHRHRY